MTDARDEHPKRDILPDDRISPAAARQLHRFHREFVDEVKAAVARDPVVVVGMAQNPFVRRAKKLLREHKIAFTAIDHGSYLGGYRRRLAIKMWAGFPTFPMVFHAGVLIGGCHELEQAIAAGTLR